MQDSTEKYIGGIYIGHWAATWVAITQSAGGIVA